jgi:protein-disulfide isomerase
MGKAARTQARERLKEQRRRDARRARNVRVLGVATIAIAVVVAIVVVGVLIQTQRNEVSGVVRPSNLTADGGVAFGPPSGVPVLTVYEDYQCPACKQFEERTGATIEELITEGKVRVVYKPVAIIGEESEVAGSAAMCAADLGPARFKAYSKTLFAVQPPENSGQLTPDRLIAIGKQAGLGEPGWQKCVKDRKYVGWMKDVTEKASKSGLRGTPWAVLNGQELPDGAYEPAGLRKAVEFAASRGAGTTPPGSPSPPSGADK